MNTFKNWLDSKPGNAELVRRELGINATNVSNVKAQRRPMPISWMQVVTKLSKGKLKLRDLIAESNAVRQARKGPQQ